MQVRIVPMPGCMTVFMSFLTLGIAPIAIALAERRWPIWLDEEGLVTRAGRRIAWQEITTVTRVVTRVQGAATERWDLHSAKGTVSVVAHRLEAGDQVLQYIWDRLPEAVTRGVPDA